MTSSRNEISDADLRRHFLRAVSMLERPECDRAFVNRVLMACVSRDPGNLIIVEKFLDNLSKMHAGQRRSKPGFRLRRAIKKAASANDWVALFHFAPEALAHDPWNVPTLLALADACEAVDYREVGLRYLYWALDAQSDNAEVNRRCGRWLAQLGRFDEALACWRQVERNTDDDVEAAQMIAQLTTGNEQAPEADAGEKEKLKISVKTVKEVNDQLRTTKGELKAEIKEISKEIWYQGEKGNYDRDSIQEDWQMKYSSQWRNARVSEILFIIYKNREEILRILKA